MGGVQLLRIRATSGLEASLAVGEIREKEISVQDGGENARQKAFPQRIAYIKYRLSARGKKSLSGEAEDRLSPATLIIYCSQHADGCRKRRKLRKMGVQEWIEKKMAAGEIRNIGFSYHGNTNVFKQLVDAYDWDFCQIQYNYMDERSQAGVDGLRYANSKGLPVIIMEPLRGGRLVDLLPTSAKQLFWQDPDGRTPAALAFRWLYDQPEVTCVLSGMNSMEMVRQNLDTADAAGVGCLTEQDRVFLDRVKAEIQKSVKVGCTGCGYCMPCPKGVDIPLAFRCYNEMASEGKRSARREYLQCTAFRRETSSASQCVGCGKCEKHCPQQIAVRKELKNAAKALETPVYKAAKGAIQLFKLW